ncbi:MAG: TonB-dependent receptor [Terracidiphilus sp.]|jgi:hypothetical protein
MRNLMAKMFPLLFIFLVSVQLRAQDVASITGVVTDPTGAVIPGVAVTLQNPQTDVTYKTVSNAEGSYTFNEVRPGPGYKIEFTHAGFKPLVISGMYLNVDTTRTENARLSVGTEQQTVQVSAAAENVTLDTTDATVGNNFEVQFVNDMPIEDRSNPAALFTMQPGVTLDGAVTGARVDQSNVTLDGVDVNDNMTGCFACIVANAPVDSVQEFRGVTASPLSSAGEGGGGQYELVTRSGTNQFHGALVEYHRDTDTEANGWFSNNSGVPRAPLIRNQFGGNVGGPVLRNRLFFFFDYNARRDTLSNVEDRTVPLDSYRSGNVSYINTAGTIETLSPTQVASYDPQGVGYNQSILSVYSSRYPHANDLSGDAGDLINSAGFRFNAPFPYVENDYVQRVDYTLNSRMKIFGRGTFTRTNGTESSIQFPGDPVTHPYLDQSYSWVAGHTWTIGQNMVNQAEYGEAFESYNWPDTYNKTGITQWGSSWGGNGTGGSIMSGPYSSAVNAQGRSFPIPFVKDDFSWQKGRHSITLGGTFKWETPDGYTNLDYNEPGLGLGGNIYSLSTSGANPLRPADLNNSSQDTSFYDQAFTFALGRFASSGATFNYGAKGNLLPQGTGSVARDRYYETEIYAGDTWKLTPDLAISYGIRWQNYTVPYDTQGIESVPTMNFNQVFGARLTQSASGTFGNTAVPFVSYVLGGKANNAPGYFNPVNHNFAPRLAFAYSPSYDKKTVFSGGAGIIYDHTVVNSVMYQLAQYSYLFQASANHPYGVSGDPVASLMNDPRFTGLNNPPPPPTSPAAISAPYTPFVTGTGSSAVPFGLINGGAFNEGVDNTLKTPYSIQYNFGFQHEFPAGLLLKMSYVGRQGRRLLGQADANQLIDFPDSIGNSGQMMSTAFANMEQDVRALPANTPITTAQPWFENMIPAGFGASIGFANNTDLVARGFAPLPYRGDFADTVQALAAYQLIPPNVGMGSQYSEFTYYTNKGFSGYNGLLVTLHKNAGYGLQFDLNYTWSHSIDDTSLIANQIAFGGYGFICDVVRPRECRGNSDFDVTNYLNGNFIYELPFGRGKSLAATAPLWANEIIGGWEVSGLPSWHTGNAYQANSNAFVAGYANDAPATLTGPIALLRAKVNGGKGARVNMYTDPNAALAAFHGPVGFQIGTRNPLRGPGWFNIDLGVGKTFPVYEDKVNLKFRADAFNSTNHPSFNTPCSDITEASCYPFGNIGSTASGARVLQGALRLEF